MGLNNHGPQKISRRIARSYPLGGFVTGVNLAKTHDPKILEAAAVEDFRSAYQKMSQSGQFTVLNVSCPNSGDGRTFEDPVALETLLAAVSEIRKNLEQPRPLLVKLSPDLSIEKLQKVVEVAQTFAVDGYVLVNTTNSRENLSTDDQYVESLGRGGVSGKPLQQRAIERVRLVAQLTGGSKPIIGVGGIDSAATAYQFITAGASLVELYTAMVYRGPRIASEINRGLLELLDRDGFNSISEAIGTKT